MALTQKSIFLYGLQVTTLNQSIDFKTAIGGPVLQATVPLGYYSLGDLMNAVIAAMEAVVTGPTFAVTADRSFSGGTQNRVTIVASGTAFFSLLFASGPRAASSIAALIGFAASDRTGALTYTGTGSCGTVLQPVWWAFNYRDPTMIRTNYGAVNVSANGTKESVTFQIQQFFEMQFKYEPQASVKTTWAAFMTWAIQQQPLEFTEDITNPNTVFNCTLETTDADGQGLSYEMMEMISEGLPFLYDTGMLRFRLKVS